MSKLSAILDLFRYGGEVANAESWKRGQVTVNSLVALLAAAVALARSFGYDIPVTNDGIAAIAGGLFAATNLVFTVISSSRIGVLPAKVQPNDSPALDSQQSDSNSGKPGEPVNPERGY